MRAVFFQNLGTVRDSNYNEVIGKVGIPGAHCRRRSGAVRRQMARSSASDKCKHEAVADLDNLSFLMGKCLGILILLLNRFILLFVDFLVEKKFILLLRSNVNCCSAFITLGLPSAGKVSINILISGIFGYVFFLPGFGCYDWQRRVVAGITEWWQALPSGGRQHRVVAGNTEWWQATPSGGRQHRVVAGITEWWQATPSGGRHYRVVAGIPCLLASIQLNVSMPPLFYFKFHISKIILKILW